MSERYNFQSRPTTAYSEDSVAAPQGGMTALAHNKVRRCVKQCCHGRATASRHACVEQGRKEARASQSTVATVASKPPPPKRNLASLLLNAEATLRAAPALPSPGSLRKRKGAATLFHLAHAAKVAAIFLAGSTADMKQAAAQVDKVETVAQVPQHPESDTKESPPSPAEPPRAVSPAVTAPSTLNLNTVRITWVTKQQRLAEGEAGIRRINDVSAAAHAFGWRVVMASSDCCVCTVGARWENYRQTLRICVTSSWMPCVPPEWYMAKQRATHTTWAAPPETREHQPQHRLHQARAHRAVAVAKVRTSRTRTTTKVACRIIG